jgi:hypothetical protein
MLSRRSIVISGVLYSIIGTPSFSQQASIPGRTPSSARFIPGFPWVEFQQNLSSTEDKGFFIARFSGVKEESQIIVIDENGRALGLGRSPDVSGNISRDLENSLKGDNVTDFGEMSAKIYDNGILQQKWVSNENTSALGAVSFLTSLVGLPPLMRGWVLVWSPDISSQSSPFIKVGEGKHPQIEGVVHDLMTENKLFAFVKSAEIDSLMSSRKQWSFSTQTLDGGFPGKLYIVKVMGE